MAKKKKKKKKARSAPPQRRTIETLINEINKAISEKRDRKAHAMAKDAMNHHDFNDSHRDWIVKAYELRLNCMLLKKQVKEARVLYESLIKKDELYKTRYSPDIKILMDLSSGSREMLGLYNTSPGITAAIDDYILKRSTDINKLAEYDNYSADNTLKQEAHSLLTAWQEVESRGGAQEGYREMLRVVKRRSPLINWRLFIQGLSSFYNNKDQEALGIFSKMTPENSFSKIITGLTEIINRKENKSETGREIESLLKVESLYSELRTIDNLHASEKYKQAEHRFSHLMNNHRFIRKSGLQKRLGALFLAKCMLNNRNIRNIVRKFPNFPLVVAEAVNFFDDMNSECLEDALHACKKKLDPISIALLNSKIAEYLTGDLLNINRSSFSFFRRNNFNFKKRAVYQEAVDFWEESVKSFPLQETYKVWFEEAKKILNRQKAEKVLERWYADFPEDIFPLIGLVESCRKRGVYKKALRYFKTLDQLARNNPGVEAIRNYLHIDDAVNYIIKAKPEKALAQLESMSGREKDDSFIADIIRTLLWIVGKPASRKELDKEIFTPANPLVVYYVLGMLSNKKVQSLPEIPGAITSRWQKDDDFVSLFSRLLNVKDPAWQLDCKNFFIPDVKDYFYTTGVDSTIIRKCLECLFAMISNDRHEQIEEILWQLTGNGIRRNDDSCFLFLAYRGKLYVKFLKEEIFLHQLNMLDKIEEYYNDCFGAAYRLAGMRKNINDPSLVKYLASEVNLFDDIEILAGDLTKKKITSIVKTEGAVYSKKRLKAKIKKQKNRAGKRKKKSIPEHEPFEGFEEFKKLFEQPDLFD